MDMSENVKLILCQQDLESLQERWCGFGKEVDPAKKGHPPLGEALALLVLNILSHPLHHTLLSLKRYFETEQRAGPSFIMRGRIT